MTTYIASFYASHCHADEDIEAPTPEQALQKARALYERNPVELGWCDYDADYDPLESIAITDSAGQSVCGWQSEELLLQQAAGDLFDAMVDLIDQIDSLTGESSCIDEDIKRGDPYLAGKAALAKAKGGAA